MVDLFESGCLTGSGQSNFQLLIVQHFTIISIKLSNLYQKRRNWRWCLASLKYFYPMQLLKLKYFYPMQFLEILNIPRNLLKIHRGYTALVCVGETLCSERSEPALMNVINHKFEK